VGRSNTTRRGPLATPEVRADDRTLTSFSGIVPFLKYVLEELGLASALRRVAPPDGRRRDFAQHLVLLAFLASAVVGEHRLAHVADLRGDAVLSKFLRLPRWPVRKVFASALANVTKRGVARLHELIADIALAPLAAAKKVVIDLDSSAVVAFGRQEGTRFGYSGKGRNKRRHNPLVASIAELRMAVRALYRDGSGISAAETIGFLEQTFATVRARVTDDVCIVFRADSGFWSKDLAAWLLNQSITFAFSMPLRPGLKLMLRNTRWRGLDGDPDVQVCALPGPRVGIDARLQVIGIRRRVHDEKVPPQGKRIAGCTRWRYQAVVTSMDGLPEELWRFYNGRADCERVFRTARQALGMGNLISQRFRANEVAFMLRLLAMNLDLRFQLDREDKAQTAADRQTLRQGLILRQRTFFRCPGRLLQHHGRWILRVPKLPRVQRLWQHYAPGCVALE